MRIAATAVEGYRRSTNSRSWLPGRVLYLMETWALSINPTERNQQCFLPPSPAYPDGDLIATWPSDWYCPPKNIRHTLWAACPAISLLRACSPKRNAADTVCRVHTSYVYERIPFSFIIVIKMFPLIAAILTCNNCLIIVVVHTVISLVMGFISQVRWKHVRMHHARRLRKDLITWIIFMHITRWVESFNKSVYSLKIYVSRVLGYAIFP